MQCPNVSVFFFFTKSREVERKRCTSSKQQQQRQRQRVQQEASRQSRLAEQLYERSKMSAAETKTTNLNESKNSDGGTVATDVTVKSLQSQEQQQKEKQEKIDGAAVNATSTINKDSRVGGLQQQLHQSGLDADKLTSVEGTSFDTGPNPLQQQEAEKYVKDEKQSQQNSDKNGENKGEEDSDIITLFEKLQDIRSLYIKFCCHGCDSEKVKIGCSWCRVALYCSVECANNDHKVKHFKHCSEMLKLRADIREKYFNDFYLPLLYRQKLSLLVSEHDPKRCCSCSKHQTNRKFRTCAKCACAMYCSKTCQVKDWSVRHNKRCAEIKRLRELLYESAGRSVTYEGSMPDTPDIDYFIDTVLNVGAMVTGICLQQFGYFPEY